MLKPMSRKREAFTRVHVLHQELEHRRALEESGRQLSKSSSTKAPSQAVATEYMERVKQEDLMLFSCR